MKTIAALAAAVALAAAPVTAGVLASDFGAARFQAVTNDTTAPATTTPTPAATPVPAPVSTDTTNATTAAPDDGSNDDSLIRPLRDGEVIEQLPGLVLLQDATSAAASVAMTSTRAVAPWTFKAMGRQLVAADDDDRSSSKTVACSSADNLPDQGKFNVLVAVSTCFDKKSFTYIQSWLASLGGQDARYFDGDDTSSVNFDIKFVDDGCDKPSWCKYDMIKEDDRKAYVATISIMVYSRGCKTIQKFCGQNQIPTTIGYVYNGPVTESVTPLTKTVNTLLPGYTPAQWVDDTVGFLGRFNPFGTARKLHCANLPGGVPTSYIQNKHRKCFCTCPVGTEMKNGACVPTTTPWDPLTGDEDCQCAWITKSDGYKLLTKYETNNVCMFKNLAISGTSGLLPVPMVVDNYVDHYRSNVGDNVSPLGSSPRIELMNQRVSVTVTSGPDAGAETVPAAVTNKYTWKTFQASTDAPINKLEFTHVGRYNVQLKATDYGSVDATCPACVLVVDSYRPTANPSFQCPKAVGDVTAELTATNVGLIQKATNGLKAFKTNALNDPCSPNTRCDEDSLQTKKFVEADYSAPVKTLDGASTFFDVEVVKADLRDRLSLSTSPFDSTQTNGLSTGVQEVCIRCIKASTTLKEWWTDYKCDSAQATAKCEGTAACALTQCLQVNGATLAIASANLKDSIKKSSLAVVKALAGNEKKSDTDLTTQFGLGTNVHIALECTQFPGATDPADPKCVYSSKLGDLVDFGATPAISALVRDALFNLADVRGFVAWRYRVDAGAWRLFDAANVESFSKSETSVTLEAWTKCGLVKSFTFKIVLHLNNKIQVCDKFNDMWYQATRETPKLPVNLDSLCMHPKSDFAEVTFDYHPNIGVVNSAFEMTINKVKCTLKYDGSGTNATIVDVSASPTSTFQIVKEFSIDGVTVATTQPETTVFVACTFTYKRTLDATTDTQVCNRKFVIKDCTPPKISKPCPSDGKCDFNKCAAAKPADPRRDLYQACGGNRISQSADSKTILTTAETQCCPSCDTKYYVTKCKAIRDTPAGLTTDNAFIKRCEPEAVTPNTPTDNTNGGVYGSSGQYGQYSVLAAAVEDLQAQPTSTLALVGATAMVAVVALVVVRRRQRETAMIEEDAYYPLMG